MSDEEFEEIERIVLGLEEPDQDLYDRVAYLELVKAHQMERKRRFQSMMSVRESTDNKLSPIEDFSSRAQSTIATVGLSPQQYSQQQQQQQPSSSADINHSVSADNLLQIRVNDYNQQPPPEAATDTLLGKGLATAKSPRARQQAISQQMSPVGGKDTEGGGMVDARIRNLWAEAVELSEIRNVEDQTEFRSLRHQLGIDKISAETLSQYHVKGHMDHFDHPAICYPRYRGPSTRNRVPSGLKLIRRVGDKLVKENYPGEEEKVKFSGMFGLHMITNFDNRVVLTTNERDALAVYDTSNGIPALSLPNGERFDPTVLPYLEDFDLVYLWFPQIHERYAKDYASYMNAARCYIITAALRPVELVRDGRAKEVLHSIQDAVRVRFKGFRSVGDLRDAVRSEIVQSKSKLTGIAQWKRYSILNNYMRGFRPGEITLLSGGSHGKTTFLYSMDLYTQGMRTLFCNFEMPEEKILKWMIIQFAAPSHVRSQARSRSGAFFSNRPKVPLQREHSSVEMWLDKFERTQSDLLIMKMDEFRDKSLKEIADAIRDQLVNSGTQHLVIDNLQSLVDLATVNIDTMNAAERQHQQDRFVAMLRRLASSQEIHITLVVHPTREPNEQGYYELQHISGPSAKIIQEADNVLVIQRRREGSRFRKFIYILKNRYGGRCMEVDQIEMLFQPTTLMHSLVEVNK